MLALVAPQIGLRSLAMARGGNFRFVGAGALLLVIAAAAGWAAWLG
jgi:hypothetical protein